MIRFLGFLQKKEKLILIAVLLVTIYSCNKYDVSKILVSKHITEFESFPQERNINLSKLATYKSGTPIKMLFEDSTLFFLNLNRGMKCFLKAYYVQNNSFSTDYIPYGRGPGESIGGFDIGIYKNKIWVYDITLQKILEADISLIKSGKPVEFHETHKIPTSHMRFDIEFLSSSTFLGLSSPYDINNTNTKIEIVEIESQEIRKTYGEFYNISKIPIEAVKRGFRKFLFVKPSKDKAALAYLATDILEIFDLRSSKSNAILGPYKYSNDFNIFNRRGRYITEETKSTISTYTGGAVTNNYIYLAYSGLKTWENPSPNGNVIFVFNWEGKPVEKLVLNTDYKISCLAVSEDDSKLYPGFPL